MKFVLPADVVIVDVTRLTKEQARPWADRSWQVMHKFEDGVFVVRDNDGHSFLVHDLTGLRHLDGEVIRPAFDQRGCERSHCERNSIGLCGRFGE